jgi:hypothetical protein
MLFSNIHLQIILPYVGHHLQSVVGTRQKSDMDQNHTPSASRHGGEHGGFLQAAIHALMTLLEEHAEAREGS